MHAERAVSILVTLGPVDRFYQDQGTREPDESAVAFGGLLAPQDDALEAFQLADSLLDAGPVSVKHFGKKAGLSSVFERYGMTGMMRRWRQALRLAVEL